MVRNSTRGHSYARITWNRNPVMLETAKRFAAVVARKILKVTGRQFNKKMMMYLPRVQHASAPVDCACRKVEQQLSHARGQNNTAAKVAFIVKDRTIHWMGVRASQQDRRHRLPVFEPTLPGFRVCHAHVMRAQLKLQPALKVAAASGCE